jgi:hypothetical protein
MQRIDRFIFGSLMCFFGYRLFLFLLPVWGFFFGLVLGAQSMQALFGTGFLSEITSWVVGFVVGLIFAVLSYLFYTVAVAVVAGSLGYLVAVGLLLAIGMDMEFLLWLIGIIVAVVFAFGTLLLNLQKWVIIIATALRSWYCFWLLFCHVQPVRPTDGESHQGILRRLATFDDPGNRFSHLRDYLSIPEHAQLHHR